MIGVSSACSVGVRVAARLTDRTRVLLAAPRDRIGEARAAVAALLGRDPGDRLDVAPDDLAPGNKVDGSDHGGRIEEIWHLAYATSGAGDQGEAALAGAARQTGARYRRFDLDPVAEAPDALVPGAFFTLLEALNATVQEVRSRARDYFEQRALRTTLAADLAFLDAASAASEVVSAAAGPPGHCRIAAAAGEGASLLSHAIGEAYEIELILGVELSALSAVDRLFESRLGGVVGRARAPGPVRLARAAGAPELAGLVSTWRQHHAASSRAERSRLAGWSAAAAVRSPRGGGPAFQVFGQRGPLVVIVNAIAQDLRYWVRVVDRLARDHRVVTWAQRSLGDDGEVARFDDHVRDLAAVIDEVAEGPVHLVGWCTGPKLCARYYLAHPRRVASMVFLAGTYRPFGDSSLDTTYEITLEMVFKLLDRSPSTVSTVRTTLLDAVSARRSKAPQAPDLGTEVLARIDPELLPSVAAPYASDESTLRYAQQIREFWSRSIEPDAAALRVPVLVVGAELDRIASSRLGLRVAQALPEATYVELPGATHYCMYDRPDEVASLLGRFIDAREPRRAATSGALQ